MFAENFGINYILAKKWTKEYSLQQFCLNVQKIISKSNLLNFLETMKTYMIIQMLKNICSTQLHMSVHVWKTGFFGCIPGGCSGCQKCFNVM